MGWDPSFVVALLKISALCRTTSHVHRIRHYFLQLVTKKINDHRLKILHSMPKNMPTKPKTPVKGWTAPTLAAPVELVPVACDVGVPLEGAVERAVDPVVVRALEPPLLPATEPVG